MHMVVWKTSWEYPQCKFSCMSLSNRQVAFIGKTEPSLRLGLSSGVTSLHLEDIVQRTILPLHSLCSLTFPQHRRLSFEFAPRAALA